MPAKASSPDMPSTLLESSTGPENGPFLPYSGHSQLLCHPRAPEPVAPWAKIAEPARIAPSHARSRPFPTPQGPTREAKALSPATSRPLAILALAAEAQAKEAQKRPLFSTQRRFSRDSQPPKAMSFQEPDARTMPLIGLGLLLARHLS